MRESTYPHSEQIRHNTDTRVPLGVWLINSSELPGLICIAALRREISAKCRLGFPCECINSLQRVCRFPDPTPTTEEDRMAAADNLRSEPGIGSWRTPLVIIVCGCVIALLSFGPRSSLGFFVQPMSREFSWGRDVFGLALAVQNLLWALAHPIAAAIPDRSGLLRAMCVAAVPYAAGRFVMRLAATPLSLDVGACVLIGFGLSGCSFNLVLSVFSKLLPPERRGVALGAGTAAGSFGQFLFAPFGVAMIDNFGWQTALTVFAALMLLIIPLSLALAPPPSPATNVPVVAQQSFKTALAEAFGHRSYVLLVLG